MAKVSGSFTGGIFALHFFSPCIKYLELVNEEGPLNCQCHSLRALFSLREILT